LGAFTLRHFEQYLALNRATAVETFARMHSACSSGERHQENKVNTAKLARRACHARSPALRSSSLKHHLHYLHQIVDLSIKLKQAPVNGKFSSCSDGFVAFGSECTGTECNQFNNFANMTCTTSGDKLSCSNGVTCKEEAFASTYDWKMDQKNLEYSNQLSFPDVVSISYQTLPMWKIHYVWPMMTAFQNQLRVSLQLLSARSIRARRQQRLTSKRRRPAKDITPNLQSYVDNP
jgi:hypothetical protein